MIDHYIAVAFKADEDQTSILTALLMDEGFEGVEEKDHETIAFIAEHSFNETALQSIFQKMNVLYTLKTIAPQNWNASWEESFAPVQIDDFVSIRASFHPRMNKVIHDIIITPKMSFGTGHHATTFLMIQEMRDLNFKEKTVIDFGTGTGVLAILAEKLGAREILAIDHDEWSINNAQENIESNNCHKINLLKADVMIDANKANIILANINLNVIITNIHAIKKACFEDTHILISGLLLQDEIKISEVLVRNGLQKLKIVKRHNWMAILTKLK
jgi:ribosomal protein L11 methyltransferase